MQPDGSLDAARALCAPIGSGFGFRTEPALASNMYWRRISGNSGLGKEEARWTKVGGLRVS
jgi:hypothetical protein